MNQTGVEANVITSKERGPVVVPEEIFTLALFCMLLKGERFSGSITAHFDHGEIKRLERRGFSSLAQIDAEVSDRLLGTIKQ